MSAEGPTSIDAAHGAIFPHDWGYGRSCHCDGPHSDFGLAGSAACRTLLCDVVGKVRIEQKVEGLCAVVSDSSIDLKVQLLEELVWEPPGDSGCFNRDAGGFSSRAHRRAHWARMRLIARRRRGTGCS